MHLSASAHRLSCIMKSFKNTLSVKRSYSKIMQFVSPDRPNLVLLKPVPSDIDISQSVAPERAVVIAANAGILPDEVESYGKYKAKVSL